MMFVNGMTAGIAYALRGMHLQLSGMQDAGLSADEGVTRT
jgi:hypothetical protein